MTVKSISGSVTLMTTLIIVTPLCGLIFLCGCDWPWSGLDARCNFYRADAEHQCPWCASLVTGLLSTGLAISCGVLTAMVPAFSLATHNSVIEITVRTLAGLTIFVLMAILTGGSGSLLAALSNSVQQKCRTHFFPRPAHRHA